MGVGDGVRVVLLGGAWRVFQDLRDASGSSVFAELGCGANADCAG